LPTRRGTPGPPHEGERQVFTKPEQDQARILAEAGISARYALRMIEGVLPTATNEVTRPDLAATLHPLLEVVEGASNALSFLSGAIAVRGEAEKPAAREWDRAKFMERCFLELDAALHEAAEAFERLAELDLMLPGQDNVALARIHLTRANARLLKFNRKLAYADPNAFPGVDELLQRDVMTNLYRSSGQYLYDGLEAVLAAYSSDPPILEAPFLVLLKDALWMGWLIQDDLAKQTARCLGIEWVVGEHPVETAFWETIATTSPRFQFCLTYIAYMLAAGPVLKRPELQKNFILASRKIADAWKRMDYFVGLLPVMAGWMAPRKPFGQQLVTGLPEGEVE
jgi:hypothetical protein